MGRLAGRGVQAALSAWGFQLQVLACPRLSCAHAVCCANFDAPTLMRRTAASCIHPASESFVGQALPTASSLAHVPPAWPLPVLPPGVTARLVCCGRCGAAGRQYPPAAHLNTHCDGDLRLCSSCGSAHSGSGCGQMGGRCPDSGRCILAACSGTRGQGHSKSRPLLCMLCCAKSFEFRGAASLLHMCARLPLTRACALLNTLPPLVRSSELRVCST